MWLRQFTRLHRPVAVLRAMEKQVKEIIANLGEPTFMRSELRTEGMGYGINAARGSLGHWLKVRGGKIENYQVITQTTWNGSPRDSWGRRGHWEESFIGLEIRDLDNPVEVGHLIRSHDACLICTVHFANTGLRKSFSKWRLGALCDRRRPDNRDRNRGGIDVRNMRMLKARGRDRLATRA